jgi:PAS domain S-box-containing protein
VYEALDSIADGLLMMDGAGRLTYVNATVIRMFGRAREDLLGRVVWDAFPEAVSLSFFTYVHRVQTGHSPIQFECYYPPLELWLETRLVPLANGGLAADIHDISDHKQLKRALGECEERSRTVFHHATTTAMVRTALDGRYIEVNDRFCAMIGRTREDVLACSHRDVTHPDDVEIDAVCAQQLLTGTRDSYTTEKRYLRRDGSTVRGSLTMSLVRDANGMPQYFIGAIEDTSERDRLERERTMMMRVVGHDLITPLTAIRVYVQAQQRRLSRGEAPFVPNEALVMNIEYALERATRLLDDLQTATGIEIGLLHLNRAPCDLAEICRREVAVQRVITNRDILLTVPDEPATILADSERLGQVVANLLSNALKYSPASQPVVLTLRQEGGQTRVAVRDAGPGISQAEQRRIWEQFHRVPGIETQDGSSGLGLGLYISRSIIEGHGGQIGVESMAGNGSTFWFTLPVAPANL